ncbi:hypothetical protein SESBI_00944 [Sesbania bispinosa]|nr:hypothetical protein SESBI_00944 [Sesbania bispinosa]
MENDQMTNKDMKVRIPPRSEGHVRLHRTPSLQRTKSMESESLRDQASTVLASMVDATTDDANKNRMH